MAQAAREQDVCDIAANDGESKTLISFTRSAITELSVKQKGVPVVSAPCCRTIHSCRCSVHRAVKTVWIFFLAEGPNTTTEADLRGYVTSISTSISRDYDIYSAFYVRLECGRIEDPA